MKKHLKLGGLNALGLALLIMLIVALACAPEEAVPRSYSCAVYTEQGCAKFVVASGGEIEIQSGGTFDLQSGATVDFSGGVDLDGGTLTWDPDGDTTSAASTDDTIVTTLGAVTGTHNILTGCLKVGNGTPGLTLSDEDAYVEGTFEVDGTVRLDGVAGISNGTAGAPGLSFTSDTDSGIYRIGADNVGMAVNATLISDWSSASMDMNNLPIVNIGAAGTDFGSDGSLTTAQTITVTAGGLVVSAGGATITAGGLDMTDDPITNIGAAGTDFGTDGSLTTAQTITVTAGGLVVSAGGATITAGGLDIVDGNMNANDFLIMDAASAIDCTGDAVITPTGTYQQLTASGATTPTVTTSGITAGTLLLLVNTAAQDVLIQDSGTMMLNASRTLNQYDTLSLLFDGTNWLELSFNDN